MLLVPASSQPRLTLLLFIQTVSQTYRWYRHTTPKYTLSIASSTRAQLALSDGSLTSDQFVIRSINQNLYFATSSAATQQPHPLPSSHSTLTAHNVWQTNTSCIRRTGVNLWRHKHTLYTSSAITFIYCSWYRRLCSAMSGGVPTWVATSSINNGVSSIAIPAYTHWCSHLATSSTAFNGLTASTTITGSGSTLTYTNTLLDY